ncbi:MAG: 1-(5-phosphoribosyl)-5-[(5-phosphoribosylamino)methylideneamino]imidazole-4-carboxamide isomerase [Anaerolineaceae bacterium]|nr:1-(5-phosphoribosyl)-5-[(5-phosphoribosylamino)methylideneamino]imidazole-4-carboxamide isomerase [Anaerolineaceae bacterium]
MIIYPAIDLRGGKVVRLKEGDPNQQKVFSDDPIATAQQWLAQGAQWIHIVNLDGTFATLNDNARILEAVAKFDVKVQFGGGLRTMNDIERAIEQGASRVIIGTAAIEQPELVSQAIERWGSECVAVGLDARDGKVATHGWQTKSKVTPLELGKQMVERGVIHALYTDVNRDGLLQGVNVDATAMLAQETGMQVIASGGVGSLDDIKRLKATGAVAGAVIGMALYDGRFGLADALVLAEGKDVS